ncbi:hypothetical protein HY251_19005, partial [bacterium]|nr:hypothetical protein [bacterium]
MEKCAPNADVPFDAEVNLAAKGKLLAGKKAQLIVKVSADSLYPDDASVGDLLLKPPLEMTFNGDDAKLEKWHLNCDPAAHPFSDRDSKKYIPKYEEPSDPMKPTDEIQKIAAEQFDYCAKTLVDKHRVFYWWSDHAHYHAADIGKKMNDWVKFFLHPHVRGGILPDSPGWKNIYGPLAAWSGYLHDLGMGANERLRAELDFLEGRDGADLEARATLAADTFKELGVTRVPLDRLGTYLGLLGKPVDEVKRRGLRAIAKEYLANHDDGIRSRHSLNSTLYCIGEKHASADKLRKHFSKYLLQKLAMTVCMHSKSRYGKKAMTFDALDTGYKDIKKNADNLFGALDAKDGTAKEGPKMEKWGPWLSAGLKFTFATDVAAAVNAPFDSPAVVSNEREYEDVLAKCIGVVDNMRDRGNEGKFRDNQ